MERGLNEDGEIQVLDPGFLQGIDGPSAGYFTQVSSALPERWAISLYGPIQLEQSNLYKS